MKRGLFVNLGLGVAVSAAFLALLEGGSRLVEWRRPPRPRPPVADYIWDWDDKMPGGFYVMKSDAAGWPPWEEFDGDGLRDRTRPHEKADLVRRVAILGDSVTLGAEVRPRDAYPSLLEESLQSRGQAVEVMNVALWGWSTRQERIAWQRIARRYHPDGALLAVCLNDIPELFNNLSRPPRWLTALHARSALVRLLVNAEGREIDSVERLFSDPDSRRVRLALDRFFEEVRSLRREVEQDGATFAVIVFPFRFQLEPSAPRPIVQERIAAFCSAERLRCLDLLPAFRRMGRAAFLDYDHLTPEGARLTADVLLASGLLPDAEAAPAVLTRALRDDRSEGADGVRAWLAAQDAPMSAAGARALAERLQAGDASLRRAAAWALEHARGSAALEGGALERALRDDPSSGVRAAAASALGTLGASARGPVPPLLDALADPSEAVRHEAARALAALGPSAEDVPRLTAALASPDDYVSAFAAWSLGNLGKDARSAVPALAQALAREKTDAVVSGALARIGPSAVDAVPVLVGFLEKGTPDRRWRAARTLGRIGPPAAAAVPALTTAVGDPESLVRMHAARALGRVGPAARPAAAVLQRATGDPDEGVRREARQALDKLH